LILNLRGSGTLTFNGKTTAAVTLLDGSPTIADTVTCTTFTVNGGTWNFTTGTLTPTTSFIMTSGSFTYNGGTLGAVPTFTHTAGTVQFNYSYALTATGTYTFTAGTLNINDGITLSTGIFSSTNTNTRTINFGLTTSPGYIALTHTTAATVVLSMAIVTGLTVNAKGKWDGTTYGPTQVAGGFRSATTVTKTFTCGTTGGNSANAPCLYVSGTGATQLPTFTTGSWFGDFYIADLSTMTIAATTLNINTLYSLGYFYAVNTTSMNLNFVGSGTCRNDGDFITTTYGTLGAVTINHSGTTQLVYSDCVVTTLTFTSGTLECRLWVNGPYGGYSKFYATGVFTQTGGTWYNNAVYIGSCTTYTNNGATVSFNSGAVTATTSFVSTSGSFTFNGGTLSAVPTFTHTAGTVTFNYNYSLTTTGTYTLTAGTLTLANGVILATGIFSSTGAGTRSIGFGASITSGSVALDGSSQYLTVPSSTQLTFGTGDYTVETWVKWTTLTTSAIFESESINGFNLYYDTGSFLANYLVVSNRLVNQITYNWIPSVNTWYHIAISRSGTNAQMFINGIIVATNAADTTNYATSSYRIGSDVSSGWYLNGNISNLRVVKGVGVYTGNFTVPTSPLTATQSSGTNISAITSTQTSLLLNTVKGAGFLTDSSTYNTTVTNNNAATSSILSPFVGMVNLTHTTAATVVLNMAAAGGFSWTGSGGFTVADMANTRTFSVANTSGGSTTTAPNLYFTTGASVATLTTGSWFNNLDFGTTSFTLGTTSLNIDGDLTLSSSGTYTGLTASILGTGTVTTNAKTIVALTIGSATLAGTATLADAITLSGALTLTQGSLTCSTYNVQSASFASTGALTRTMTGSGTYTITGSGATAFSNASTGITITGLIISMTAATAKTFAGGGGSYSTLNQGGAGALTISGSNSFADLTATTRPSTITFTISTTQTFAAFTLSGTAGNLVTINSSTAGTQATLSKSGGTVSVGYLSIRDSAATGGAGWYAGTTSTNVSNNTGWIFTAPGSFNAGGLFFAFF